VSWSCATDPDAATEPPPRPPTVTPAPEGTGPAPEGTGPAPEGTDPPSEGLEPAPPAGIEPAPPAAARLFGPMLDLATRYAELLAGPGTDRGLLGPREAPRIWSRHLLHGALLAELVPTGATVLDAGSGAGLPGIPLALARPDLTVVLLDAGLRRVTFLSETVTELGLMPRVQVLRGRLEELPATQRYPVITARAVAPLPTLRRWALPHLTRTGVLLALVGSTAAADVAADGVQWHRCGSGMVAEPVLVAAVHAS
jgi:16S rRNA (guanine527-N7)-methyltransferase